MHQPLLSDRHVAPLGLDRLNGIFGCHALLLYLFDDALVHARPAVAAAHTTTGLSLIMIFILKNSF